MYSSQGFQRSELGDVEIFRHEGFYHMFHLVLPNHDYIAHAVSEDGFLWRRVNNALFIGEPGEWDDDMLWTMSVSPDPRNEKGWRLFYTGISRKEQGMIQRIGVARSEDLFHWEKDRSGDYPLSITGPWYEESVEEGRNWVSCRDPFYFRDVETGNSLLLVSARVPYGPVIRRGCVGIAMEAEPDRFEWLPPLFFPRMYDDIEVPGLYRLNGRYYLLGNIKEDIKVHYWSAGSLFGNYESPGDNVLLPQGNYAARITREENRLLLWNFFNTTRSGNPARILPPPVEVKVAEDGSLFLGSYGGFDRKTTVSLDQKQVLPMRRILKNPTAGIIPREDGFNLSSVSGYEVFLSSRSAVNARLSFRIRQERPGKTGILLRSDEEANACYFSLDLINGFAQSRLWGVNTDGNNFESAFRYTELQHGTFRPGSETGCDVEVISFGGYFELSVDRQIVLRFVDTTYMENAKLGFYVESADVSITRLKLDILNGPEEEDHSVI